MLYCSNCQILCANQRCPQCGGKRLREPEANDPVFLLQEGGEQAFLLANILQENGIPFLKAEELGAGVTLRVGAGNENYRFFVPYGALAHCQKLVGGVFPEAGRPCE